jgi:hypothetical protein
MASFARFIRLAVGAWVFLLIVTVSGPSSAQQVNPTASSVKEQQLLQELNRIQGRVSIPDQRAGVRRTRDFLSHPRHGPARERSLGAHHCALRGL